MKIIILSLIGFIYIINLLMKILHLKNDNIPINNYVGDIYDENQYKRWSSYQKDNVKLSIISLIVSFIISILLFGFNIHSYILNFISGLTSNLITQAFYVMLFLFVIGIFDILFSYIRTFKIEEKYGFNKTNKKLFIKDQIIKFILLIGLGTPTLYLVMVIFNNFINPIIFLIISSAIIIGFSLILPFLLPLFSRLFNKFTKLEESDLKDKILEYVENVNFPVENIYVMDASKRSTKINAYFSGYGKKRRIVLYDTLIKDFTDEEVVSVLAHEAGHAKHKDMIRLLPFTVLNIIIMLMMLYLLASNAIIAQAFGFTTNNFFFGLFLFMELFGLVNIILNVFMNAFSRKIEYQADKYSAVTYSGDALISALKKLAKSNFAHLFPHKIIVLIYYSHPTLNQRITAIKNL